MAELSEAEKAEYRAEIRAYDEAKRRHPRREDLREAVYAELLPRFRAEVAAEMEAGR